MDKKLRRFLCLLFCFVLCLWLASPALGADGGAAAQDSRSWKMHPDSDRPVTAADMNAFFGGLTEDTVESLQVVYRNPREEEGQGPDISHAPTPIDPASYPQLIALLKEIRFSDPDPEKPNPLTGMGPEYFLAITTQEVTVKLALWDSSNRTVSGTMGKALWLNIEPKQGRGPSTPYNKLGEEIILLPEVQVALNEIESIYNRYLEALRNADDIEEGLARMNGPAIPPNPENPPALAVSAAEVAEYNLFQDGYWARVTAPADQKKLLNLINSVEANANPSTSPAQGGRVLLQLRLQSGEKHEYQTTQDGVSLRADGKYYFDQPVVLVFDDALSEMLSGYPVGIAWLGTMNRLNVTEMSAGGAESRFERWDEHDPQALEAAVARLRGITLHGGTSRKVPRGSVPEEIKGKTAERWLRLKFQNGITYQLNFYEGKMVSIDSSDMGFSYFYQYESIEDAA